MRIKTRRILATLLSAVLLLCIAPAAFAVDLSANKVVNIDLVPTMSTEEQTAFETDVKTAKVQADLYLIAAAEEVAGSDTYAYKTFDAPFASLTVDGKTLQEAFDAALETDPSEPAVTQKDVFSTFEPFAQAIASEVLKEEYSSDPTKSQAAAAEAATISVTDLQAGLYLLVLRGSDLTAKDNSDSGYVVTQTVGEDTTILTRAFSDEYEYLFKPQLITVPIKTDSDGNQQYGTAYNYGDWTDTLNVEVKAEREARFGNLKITKSVINTVEMADYEEVRASFSYDITATFKGKTVYEATRILTYPDDKAKNMEIIIEKLIPVGAEVTVVETYTGSHYTQTSKTIINTADTEKTKLIIPASPDPANPVYAEIAFSNTNDGDDKQGYGILNTFVYSKDENGTVNWTYKETDATQPAA